MNYTIGPPGLDNLDFQWFSNLHCKSGVLPVISERMLNQYFKQYELDQEILGAPEFTSEKDDPL